MEALAGNCTWHMLAEILESVTRLQERGADLGGTRKGQLKKQHLRCVSKGSDNLPGGKNDRMCLRLGPDKTFFRFLSVTSKSLGGHYICSIQVAWLGSVCLHLSSANILYCFCNCLAVWSVLLYSTTCLSKNGLTGGWPHAKTQLGNWLSRRGCEFNPAFIPNNKQRRGMLEHQPLKPAAMACVLIFKF